MVIKQHQLDHVYESPITQEDDDDDMFGEDIELEELDITAIVGEKNKLETTTSDIFEDLPLEELEDALTKVERSSVTGRLPKPTSAMTEKSNRANLIVTKVESRNRGHNNSISTFFFFFRRKEKSLHVMSLPT